MARVTYTALRSLKAGVNPGTVVTLDFNCEAIDRETTPKETTRIALGGDYETRRERTDVSYAITVSPVLEASFDDFRQFLDSVDGGESFTLDPYGTAGSPVLPVAVTLEKKGYKEQRVAHRYLKANFKARVIG